METLFESVEPKKNHAPTSSLYSRPNFATPGCTPASAELKVQGKFKIKNNKNPHPGGFKHKNNYERDFSRTHLSGKRT